MPWWLTPALIGGLMLYAKSKASAAFRWVLSDEDSVKGMPIALLLTKLSTGDTLPAAPNGFQWKEIELTFAASPFASPQSLKVNVLQQWLNSAQKPAGTAGFMTAEAFSNPGLAGDDSALRGNWCGTGRCTSSSSLGQLGLELRERGLVLAPVGPNGVKKGDYVVTTEGSLHVALDGGNYKELHPKVGLIGPIRGKFQSAYGIRRA